MKVLIYGTGAVGLALASCVIGRDGMEVTLLARRAETLDLLTSEGVLRTGIFGEERCPPPAFAAHRTLSGGPYDIIIVCTKSQDTDAAARDFMEHPGVHDQKTIFLLAQNGWGNTEKFLRLGAPERLYNARVITGFFKPAPNVSAVTVHAQDIHFGSLYHADIDPRLATLAAVINRTIPCTTTPTIGRDLWAKMLYNCALNPLGAICGVPYGKLGENAETRAIMDEVMDEVFEVMRLHGFTTHWATAAAYRELFYSKLLPVTSEHRSSMLQDIKAGRKTEIEALSGILITLGAEKGYLPGASATLARMVRFLEGQKGAF